MPVAILGTQIILWCFDVRNNSKFKVVIGVGNDIDDLKEAIKEKCEYGFASHLLRLWRVNTDQTIFEVLNDELKDTAKTIGETFYGVQGDNIRAVVRADTEELRAHLEALKLGHELGYDEAHFQSDLPLESEIKRIKREKEYRETVNIGLKAKPPSSGAKPSTFFTTQINNPILNGRPLELTGPPITIYNRNFTQFLEDFNNMKLKVPPDILEWVMDIISASADKYFNEDGRIKKMREILSKKFGTIALTSYGKGCQCDGLLTAKVGLLDAYIGIIKGKNEVGSDETDP
ncbi:14397_t:CDS:2, partial [Dentiscutata erythropus]